MIYYNSLFCNFISSIYVIIKSNLSYEPNLALKIGVCGSLFSYSSNNCYKNCMLRLIYFRKLNIIYNKIEKNKIVIVTSSFINSFINEKNQ